MTLASELLADPIAGTVRCLVLEARERWKVGDRYFLAGQVEMFRQRANECACEHNTCGGCAVVLACAELLRVEAAKVPGSGTADEAEAVELAHWRWRKMRDEKAKAAGVVHSNARNRERARAQA